MCETYNHMQELKKGRKTGDEDETDNEKNEGFVGDVIK